MLTSVNVSIDELYDLEINSAYHLVYESERLQIIFDNYHIR